MRKIVVLLLLTILFTSCSSAKRQISKEIGSQLKTKAYKNQFTGLLLVDAKTKDTLFKSNSTKFFTPASNTKIYTLYAALKLIPERIPVLEYLVRHDTLYVQGTGNPTNLHPYFNDSTAVNFMKPYEHIVLYLNNFQDDKYGPGWSWDDYQYYYSPERSGLPLYGNVLTIENGDGLRVFPEYFSDSIVPIKHSYRREPNRNMFYFDPKQKDTLEIPLVTDSSLTRNLLEKVLGKKVKITNSKPIGEHKVLFGIHADTIYKRMMEVSDNFLAEQLLFVASSTISDTLNSAKARKYVLEKHLIDLRQPPRWVDGSGLSRYNLFTPESMVHVLDKLYTEIPEERLFQFFPTGGVNGTLEDWYPGDPEPYIHAKTGSLSNNHCLSGYLLTKSGKTVIFSFMNNHFTENSSEVKKRMQSILEKVRDTY
ncbi:D-alanyl-D-alanine carboxypeptidase [Maribacter sp. TH_r10]|uniref:D-alanyl-D-alanine carboxypeptidase/D-alanyl-D-alanine-endopeptidase n=1 Tax=Maribacter sp. TH_r10 TaxID=3082086 RepID=UPI002954CB3D|nr:D-alanyl-D-alanine carboxypeptidase [Maribacter sp. TH_r10]MDV7138458.1 D-alanyl-D-alanine carboxypeptidase [Maribacter sp. TH_r10]